MEYARKRLT
jgi:hypothetical protein